MEPAPGYGGVRAAAQVLLDKTHDAKAATVLTLGAVLASWEARADDKSLWRHPDAWDRQVMATLTQWGYPLSDVEALLLPDPGADSTT